MNILNQVKPYIAVILMQTFYAFMTVIAKLALNQGLSERVLVPYRMAVASAIIAPFAYVLER